MRKSIIQENHTVPVNTLDFALRSAEILVRDLANQESQTYQRYRIFSALASSEGAGLIAFLIWRARDEILHDILYHK